MFRFFKVPSLVHSQPNAGLRRNLANTLANGEVTLYFWPPFPERVAGLSNKPLFGYMSGGATGHLAMGVQYSSGEQSYISILPGELPINADRPNDKPSEPIKCSASLDHDIEAEMNREPQKKTISISYETEPKLKKAIEKLKLELDKDPREREQWSLANNCATYVAKILYESGINHSPPVLIETPSSVFEITDPVEQAIYLENLHAFSHKG